MYVMKLKSNWANDDAYQKTSIMYRQIDTNNNTNSDITACLFPPLMIQENNFQSVYVNWVELVLTCFKWSEKFKQNAYYIL